MGPRSSLEPEVIALRKAVMARINALGEFETKKQDGFTVFERLETPFLQLQLKRDHITLDLWLEDDDVAAARSSGIARAHPFLGPDAVTVRFERAVDLARVARWIESSYLYAPRRALKPKVVVRDGEALAPPSPQRRSRKSPEPQRPSGPPPAAEAAPAEAAEAPKAPPAKTSAAKKKASKKAGAKATATKAAPKTATSDGKSRGAGGKANGTARKQADAAKRRPATSKKASAPKKAAATRSPKKKAARKKTRTSKATS